MRCVSIRSRPEDREKASAEMRVVRARAEFQSAPGPKTGRKELGSDRFQVGADVSIRSRPEDREKDAPGLGGVRHAVFQSAPGPKTGRKIVGIGLPLGSVYCFNPLPARRPGESVGRVSWCKGSGVSIRSRPEDREKDQRSCSRPIRCASFQSAPGPKTGRKRGHHRLNPDRRPFQSAPGPKTGRKPSSQTVNPHEE